MNEIIRNKVEGSGEHRLLCAVLLTYIEDCNRCCRYISESNRKELLSLIRLSKTDYTRMICDYVFINPQRITRYLEKKLKEFYG